jgi:hypothetical protein
MPDILTLLRSQLATLQQEQAALTAHQAFALPQSRQGGVATTFAPAAAHQAAAAAQIAEITQRVTTLTRAHGQEERR